MADVASPSSALLDKVRSLNVRRNQDWARTAAALPVGFAAGIRGDDPVAATRGFFPNYATGGTPMQKAGLRKDIIDAIQKAQDAERDDRAGLIAKLQSGNDVLEKLLQVAGTWGSAALSAAASVANDVRDKTQKLVEQTAAGMEKMASDALGGNMQAVQSARVALRELLSPEGISDPTFAQSFNNYMSNFTEIERQSFLAMLEADAMAKGTSLSDLMQEMPKTATSGAVEALNWYRNNDAMITRVVEDSMVAAKTIRLDAVKNLNKGGVLGSDYLVKTIENLMEINGLNMSPEELQKTAENLLGQMDPSNKNGDPSAAARYADLLDSMDGENPAPNLAEARRRLIEDPEFKAWMRQNGYQDSGMALKELRRLLRGKAQAARENDLTLNRQRRLGEVGADTGPEMVSPSAKAVAKGTPAPKPAQGGPAYVQNDKGDIFEWDGKALTPVSTPEQEKDLEAILTDAAANNKTMEQVIGSATEYAQYEKMAADAAKQAQPQTPAAPSPSDRVNLPQLTGMPVRVMQSKATNAMAHPGDTVNKVGDMARNLVMSGMRGKKKEVPQVVRQPYQYLTQGEDWDPDVEEAVANANKWLTP